jgi:uncharacterized protein (DUF1778 family)
MAKMDRQRLAVDVPRHIHDEIKKAANQRNCTITRWVLSAVLERLKLERLYNEEYYQKKMPKLQ